MTLTVVVRARTQQTHMGPGASASRLCAPDLWGRARLTQPISRMYASRSKFISILRISAKQQKVLCKQISHNAYVLLG